MDAPASYFNYIHHTKISNHASCRYITQQRPERQKLLTAIHTIIIAGDKTITPVVEPMMGKEMILYKANGMMKYGLASVKNTCRCTYCRCICRRRFMIITRRCCPWQIFRKAVLIFPALMKCRWKKFNNSLAIAQSLTCPE